MYVTFKFSRNAVLDTLVYAGLHLVIGVLEVDSVILSEVAGPDIRQSAMVD